MRYDNRPKNVSTWPWRAVHKLEFHIIIYVIQLQCLSSSHGEDELGIILLIRIACVRTHV